MAGVDIGRKRWPTGPAQVDTSHPLGAGLTFLFAKSFSVKAGWIDSDTTALTTTSGLGASDLSSGLMRSRVASGGPPCSFAAVFRWTSGQMHLLSNDGDAGVVGGLTGAGDRCWQFRCVTSNEINFLAFDSTASSLPVNFALPITSGVPYAAVVSLTAGRSAEMRVMNLTTSNVSVVSSTASSTGGWVGSNGHLGDTGRFDAVSGNVAAVYRWSRALSSSGMDMFLADPYCMLRA